MYTAYRSVCRILPHSAAFLTSNPLDHNCKSSGPPCVVLSLLHKCCNELLSGDEMAIIGQKCHAMSSVEGAYTVLLLQTTVDVGVLRKMQ